MPGRNGAHSQHFIPCMSDVVLHTAERLIERV